VAPPAPARECLPAELEAAWASLIEGLQPRAPSKDELAEKLALLTAWPPRKRKQLNRADDPDFRELKPRVRLVVRVLDELENQGTEIAGIPQLKLAERVAEQAGASVSVRTLRKAETYRREHLQLLF
jgi:hypothetical protein